MTSLLGTGRLRVAAATLRYIFTKPTLVGAVALGATAFYIFVCRPEEELRRVDPAGWRLLYASSPVSQTARCLLFCTTGALITLIPLFILMYVKRRISSSGPGNQE